MSTVVCRVHVWGVCPFQLVLSVRPGARGRAGRVRYSCVPCNTRVRFSFCLVVASARQRVHIQRIAMHPIPRSSIAIFRVLDTTYTSERQGQRHTHHASERAGAARRPAAAVARTPRGCAPARPTARRRRPDATTRCPCFLWPRVTARRRQIKPSGRASLHVWHWHRNDYRIHNHSSRRAL